MFLSICYITISFLSICYIITTGLEEGRLDGALNIGDVKNGGVTTGVVTDGVNTDYVNSDTTRAEALPFAHNTDSLYHPGNQEVTQDVGVYGKADVTQNAYQDISIYGNQEDVNRDVNYLDQDVIKDMNQEGSGYELMTDYSNTYETSEQPDAFMQDVAAGGGVILPPQYSGESLNDDGPKVYTEGPNTPNILLTTPAGNDNQGKISGDNVVTYGSETNGFSNDYVTIDYNDGSKNYSAPSEHLGYYGTTVIEQGSYSDAATGSIIVTDQNTKQVGSNTDHVSLGGSTGDSGTKGMSGQTGPTFTIDYGDSNVRTETVAGSDVVINSGATTGGDNAEYVIYESPLEYQYGGSRGSTIEGAQDILIKGGQGSHTVVGDMDIVVEDGRDTVERTNETTYIIEADRQAEIGTSGSTIGGSTIGQTAPGGATIGGGGHQTEEYHVYEVFEQGSVNNGSDGRTDGETRGDRKL